MKYPEKERILIVRPCLKTICLGIRPASKLLSLLLFYAKDCPEEQETFTYTCTQNELVADLIDEMDVKTLQRTAIPMLRLLGFIEVDGSSYRYCYKVHLHLIQHAILLYRHKEQLDKLLIVSIRQQLEKTLIELDKLPIEIDKCLIELDKLLIPFRKMSNSKRGRKPRIQADLGVISESLDNLDTLDSLDREREDVFANATTSQPAFSDSHTDIRNFEGEDVAPTEPRMQILSSQEEQNGEIVEDDEADEQETQKRRIVRLPGIPLATRNTPTVPQEKAYVDEHSRPAGDPELLGARGDLLPVTPTGSLAGSAHTAPLSGTGHPGESGGGDDGFVGSPGVALLPLAVIAPPGDGGHGDAPTGQAVSHTLQNGDDSTPARASGLPLSAAQSVQRSGDTGRATSPVSVKGSAPVAAGRENGGHTSQKPRLTIVKAPTRKEMSQEQLEDVKPPTRQQLERQRKQRALEIWVIVERELKGTFSKSQRAYENNTRGMDNILDDEVSDEGLITALHGLSPFWIGQFNLKKFHEMMPGLLAAHELAQNGNGQTPSMGNTIPPPPLIPRTDFTGKSKALRELRQAPAHL